MKNKNFRNPRIYQTLVKAAGLNEIGTNFPKSEFFDIEGYGPESYATGLGKYSTCLPTYTQRCFLMDVLSFVCSRKIRGEKKFEGGEDFFFWGGGRGLELSACASSGKKWRVSCGKCPHQAYVCRSN